METLMPLRHSIVTLGELLIDAMLDEHADFKTVREVGLHHLRAFRAELERAAEAPKKPDKTEVW